MTARLLSKAETAAILGVATKTLDRWAKRGHGPKRVKHGPRLVRYSRDEVMAYAAHGEQAVAA